MTSTSIDAAPDNQDAAEKIERPTPQPSWEQEDFRLEEMEEPTFQPEEIVRNYEREQEQAEKSKKFKPRHT